MYKHITFEEIDKNRWNGCVHYAHNGNVYGYYWYLKSVLKEWDAIVEDNYESVFPIIKHPLYAEEHQLLPALGPYSVNHLSNTRMDKLLSAGLKDTKTSIYSVTSKGTTYAERKYPTLSTPYTSLNTKYSYDEIVDKYPVVDQEIVNHTSTEGYKMISSIKPEDLVALGNRSNVAKNALMRIMYNALHRGIGWSSGIQNKSTGKIVAASFFLFSHNTIYELFKYHDSYKHGIILYDLMVRSQAGKSTSIHFQGEKSVLGSNQENYCQIVLDNSFITRVKRKLKLQY